MDNKYKIVYCDPPWQFNNKNTGGSMKSGASAVYPVMSVDDICRLDVPGICDDDCILFMWWVASQPVEALKVVEAWGFKLKTMTGFVWVKQTKTGKDAFLMGFYSRQGSESCLIATRGKPVVINHGVRAVLHAPVQEHSRKPVEVRDRVVQMMGDIPRVELFSREKVEGWKHWGNEVESDIVIGQK